MTKQLVLLALGLVACGDDPASNAGSSVDPTISGVFPDRAFIGRDVRVEVSGDVTHWADGTTVDFGAGVTVHAVEIGSPTSLFAEVSVADTAIVGLTDVTVTGPDGALTLHAGLDLAPPLRTTTTGTLAQGSVITLKVTNQDFDNPFDTTQKLFGGAFPNLTIETPPGVSLLGIDRASAFELVASFTIDIDAQPGELVVHSGPLGHALSLSAGTLAVAARTAIPVTPNVFANGGPLDAAETALYAFTPAAPPSVTLISIDSGQFFLLTGSGHFAESFTFDPVTSFNVFDPVVSTTDKFYMVYGANPFAEDSFQVQVTEKSLVETDETEDANDTGATAQTVQIPALFANATLSSTRDFDFVTFPVTAADVGKTVHVMTQGDVATLIDVFADQAATISLGEGQGVPFDDFTSQPIPDGTTAIYVKFSAPNDVDPEANDYLAAIFLND